MHKQVCQILQALKPTLDPKTAEPMITSGAIDPFDIIMLIIDLSNAFGVSFMPVDLTPPENFDTVDSIVALICAKQTANPQ